MLKLYIVTYSLIQLKKKIINESHLKKYIEQNGIDNNNYYWNQHTFNTLVIMIHYII